MQEYELKFLEQKAKDGGTDAAEVLKLEIARMRDEVELAGLQQKQQLDATRKSLDASNPTANKPAVPK